MLKQFKTAYSFCFTCKSGKMCILYFVTSICSNYTLIFSQSCLKGNILGRKEKMECALVSSVTVTATEFREIYCPAEAKLFQVYIMSFIRLILEYCTLSLYHNE